MKIAIGLFAMMALIAASTGCNRSNDNAGGPNDQSAPAATAPDTSTGSGATTTSPGNPPASGTSSSSPDTTGPSGTSGSTGSPSRPPR